MDGIYILDSSTKKIEKIVKDQVLVLDDLLRTFVRTLVDTLYIGDSVTTQTVTALVELVLSDGLLLSDATVQAFSKLFSDKILIGDSEIAQKLAGVISLILTDYLLLKDALVKMEDSHFTDNLLMSDVKKEELIKIVLDSLLTLDFVEKEILSIKKDSILILDIQAVQRIKQAQLLDLLLLTEVRLSSVDKTIFDPILMKSTLNKIINTVKLDTLYLTDDYIKTVYGAIIEALIYARLQTVSILGYVRWPVIDFLGRKIGVGSRTRRDS